LKQRGEKKDLKKKKKKNPQRNKRKALTDPRRKKGKVNLSGKTNAFKRADNQGGKSELALSFAPKSTTTEKDEKSETSKKTQNRNGGTFRDRTLGFGDEGEN